MFFFFDCFDLDVEFDYLILKFLYKVQGVGIFEVLDGEVLYYSGMRKLMQNIDYYRFKIFLVMLYIVYFFFFEDLLMSFFYFVM